MLGVGIRREGPHQDEGLEARLLRNEQGAEVTAVAEADEGNAILVHVRTLAEEIDAAANIDDVFLEIKGCVDQQRRDAELRQ